MSRTVIQPWGFPLYLATTEARRKRLSDRFGLGLDGDTLGSTSLREAAGQSMMERTTFVVWINPEQTSEQLRRTCIHEGVHVAALLLDCVGEQIRGDSETLAYLAEWATMWLLERVEA